MSGPDPAAAERLRAAFAAWDGALSAAGACPPAEDVWLAVAEQLPHEETRRIILHVSACGPCAEAWRLAYGAVQELPAGERQSRRAASWRSPWVWGPGMAAAALLVIGIALDYGADILPVKSAAPSFREGALDGGVRSLLADDVSLAREALALRWSEGPPGARYDVRVFTEDLSQVAFSGGVEKPEVTIPSSRLSAYPSGTRLFWQVDVVQPDGSRRPSPTFRIRLQ